MSDAPSYHLFVLLFPVDQSSTTLPDILCAIQISLEGSISKASIIKALDTGDMKKSRDLIRWTMSQQFQDEIFSSLGAPCREIEYSPRNAYQSYGSKALKLLQEFLASTHHNNSHFNPNPNPNPTH